MKNVNPRLMAAMLVIFGAGLLISLCGGCSKSGHPCVSGTLDGPLEPDPAPVRVLEAGVLQNHAATDLTTSSDHLPVRAVVRY